MKGRKKPRKRKGRKESGERAKRSSRKARKPSKRRLDSVRSALARRHAPRFSDGPPVLFLRELVREFDDPGAPLAWLVARDAERRTCDDALMMLFLGAREPSVPGPVRERIAASAVPVLLDAMRDAAVPDERKYRIGPLLSVLGAELPGPEYRSCFRDFEATAMEMNGKMLERLPEGPEYVEIALVEAGLIRHDGPVEATEEDFVAALNVGGHMLETGPEAAAAVLTTAVAIAHEHGKATEYGGPVLDRVADTRSGRAAWFLSELGRLPGTGALAERAAGLAGGLARSGVSPRPPAAGDFSHGIVSSVDGAGNRSLMLFFRTAEGELDSLGMLLSDVVGVKDVWCVFGDAADLDQDLRSRSDEIAYAPCGVELGREIVADAMATHEKAGKPFPGRFLLYRHYLGPEPIAPAARTPNLGAYMLETFSRGPEMVEDTEDAFDVPNYGGLWCGSREAYAFLRRFMPRGRRGWLPDEFALPERVFDEYVARVASKERRALARRMAVNLEIEALAGRASSRSNRAAARAWIALTEEVVPFEEIPFVRLLCTQSVGAIFANLRRGYGSQEEANRAALARDVEDARLASCGVEEDW
jgi:hypothetical protein